MKKIIAASTAAVAVSATLVATADAAEHKVQSGDTLWAISQEYGTSVAAIKAENGLNSDMIVTNQVLKINETKKNTAKLYKIVAGDTLGKIADKFDVTVAQLKSWNNLSSDLIIAGKTLKVKGEAAPAVQTPVAAAPAQAAPVAQAPAAPKKVYTAPKAEYNAPAQQQAPVQQAPVQKAAPVQQAPKAATTTTSYSGGGQNWAALAACESGGNASIVDASGTYHGLYQFDVQTWHSVGGSGVPSQASAAEQTKRAQILYSQRGSQPWPVCGARL